METLFVAADFLVPTRVEQPNFILRPLTTQDVENDYDAVMSSRESLRHIFREQDDEWPLDTMTLQDNYRDLQRHQEDFEQRKGFTYTMVTPDEQRCIGCVYIYPCLRGDYDAQVYYWVRDSVKPQGLDEELGAFLRQWLQNVWQFQHPVYPGRELPWKEWEALKKD